MAQMAWDLGFIRSINQETYLQTSHSFALVGMSYLVLDCRSQLERQWMVQQKHVYRYKRDKDQVDRIRESTHCLSFVQQAALLDMMGWGISREYPSFVNNLIM